MFIRNKPANFVLSAFFVLVCATQQFYTTTTILRQPWNDGVPSNQGELRQATTNLSCGEPNERIDHEQHENKEEEPCSIFFVILSQAQRLPYAISHSALLRQYGARKHCVDIFVRTDADLSSLSEHRVHNLYCTGRRQSGRVTKITETYKCLIDQVKANLANNTQTTDANSSYIAILEDDILPAPDFVDYLLFSRQVMQADPSVACASGWNDNLLNMNNEADESRRWTFLDPSRFYLTDQFGGLGFMIRLDALSGIGSLLLRAKENEAWDVKAFEYFETQQLQCLYPEIPRTYHIPWIEGRHSALLDKPLHIHHSVMPEPNYMTMAGYTDTIRAFIAAHCHDETQVRGYANIETKGDVNGRISLRWKVSG